MTREADSDANVRAAVQTAIGGAGVAAGHLQLPIVAAGLAIVAPFVDRTLAVVQQALAARRERVAPALLASGISEVQVGELAATKGSKAIEAMLLDEEEGKEWAYGALVGAFANDVVPLNERMTWVKFVKECVASDLQQIVRCGQMVAMCSRVPRDEALKEKLKGAMSAAGLWDEEGHPHFDVAVFWSVQLFETSNKRVISILDEYGFRLSDNHLSDRVLYELLPVLAPAAYRLEIVEPLTDDAFVDYVVEFTRARRSEAPGA